MRLSNVRFASLIKLSDGSRVDELVSDADGDLEYDPGDQVIRYGKDIIPISGNVKSMVALDLRPTCPECAQSFEDNRGLGAHRALKHGVAAQSPGRIGKSR